MLDQPRHDAGQHMPADLADTACREGRQGTEGFDFLVAVQPTLRLVENEDDTPFVRKGQPRHDRWRPAAAVIARIDDDAALGEAGDADAGPVAARQQRRVAAGVEGQAVERAQSRRDRERDLRAGAEPGVAGDCFFDDEPVPGPDAEAACHGGEVRGSAIAFRTDDDSLARPRQRHHGFGLAQRQAKAAEATAAAAAGVKKAEMEAGGHSYGNRIRHLPPGGCIICITEVLGARRYDSGFHLQGKPPGLPQPEMPADFWPDTPWRSR